jgi:predicted transcriptional regulator
MRTTLTIDDDLLKRLKQIAARQKKTLAAVVNDLLRHALANQDKHTYYKLELEGWEAEPQPGVDLLDRDQLFDLMDGR